jgi:hypothetical protein
MVQALAPKARWPQSIAAVVVAVSALASASATHAFDVTSAEIDGVRLGMTPAQVWPAIKARFGGTCTFAKTQRPLIGGEMYSSIECRKSVYRLSITFTEAIPPGDPRQELVSEVTLGDGQGIDEDHFYNSVVAKYGTPTAGYEGFAVWCAPSGMGRLGPQSLTDVLAGCTNSDPLFSYAGGVVDLRDNAAEALEKYMQRPAGRPPL